MAPPQLCTVGKQGQFFHNSGIKKKKNNTHTPNTWEAEMKQDGSPGILKTKRNGAGEMAHWLRVGTVLAEILGLLPSTSMRQATTTC